jgi:hypothetical protein
MLQVTQNFTAQFNGLFERAQINAMPAAVPGDLVVHGGQRLIDPLINQNGVKLDVGSIPGLGEAYERAGSWPPPSSKSVRDSRGMSFFGEWSRLQSLANEAAGQIRKCGTNGRGEQFLRKRARAPHLIGEMNSPIKAAETLMKAGFFLAAIEKADDRVRAAETLHATADRFIAAKLFTASAMVRELALYVGVHEADEAQIREGMIKAAHSWYLSLDEYFDPATEGMRIGRGLANAQAEPAGTISENLLAASAKHNESREDYRGAAHDGMRMVWWMLKRPSLTVDDWVQISGALQSAAVAMLGLDDVEEGVALEVEDLSVAAKSIAGDA